MRARSQSGREIRPDSTGSAGKQNASSPLPNQLNILKIGHGLPTVPFSVDLKRKTGYNSLTMPVVTQHGCHTDVLSLRYNPGARTHGEAHVMEITLGFRRPA